MFSRAQADAPAIERFKREMQVIAGLMNPNIVRFLDGGSLADVAKSRGGPLPPEVLMPWAL